MIYRGAGEEIDVILCEATEEDDGSDIILLDGAIISPTIPAQVLVYDVEESNAKVINAIYGCLPNRIIVIAVPNGLLNLAVGSDPEYPRVRVILEPYSKYDAHIVEDLILEPYEDEEDDDGSEESEISDRDMGWTK